MKLQLAITPLSFAAAQLYDFTTNDEQNLSASSALEEMMDTNYSSTPPREVVPIREYIGQQLLHALQGRGLDEWILGLEQTMAGAIANAQNFLWRNELIESLNRQRELIRRGVDNIDDDQVPSLLAPIPKRSRNSWNGKLTEEDGSRLPSFADVLADNWAQTVKETVNLPIMGPFNPALWRPEDVAEVLGPILNVIPHETAKLVKHKEEAEGLSSLEKLLIGEQYEGGGEHSVRQDLPKLEAEIPGFGHLLMDEEWHTHKIAPNFLDIPLLGPLNPAQQMAANLPPVYLPYRALRLKEHPPEWMRLDGLQSIMPINAYTPKEDGREYRRPLPIYSILRGGSANTRRLAEAEKGSNWRDQILQSKFVRSILHYLPRYRNSTASSYSEEDSGQARHLVSIVDAAPILTSREEVVDHSDDNDVSGASIEPLDSKRYYRAAADLPLNEVRGTDI